MVISFAKLVYRNLRPVLCAQVRFNKLVSIPRIVEQVRIAAAIERRLSAVAQFESTITANRARATRLRKAILKMALSFPAEEVES